ncbi:putative cytochrome B5 [Aspergillus nomiae NRRL 13137]|uniref:NADH-cytochrome b5 reductase 1 n=1 Tax=Aspergillus nomiae NRRL (strain ATCC 15546 / NRRL 13137 / CBS 260.88 / M93) TaxID=1509407 RepID=A0A0L1IUE0_ASPN3|nr:putative cytochrome B5 [Aspergillus nomiae NRRL 13137]KNG82793.1 putative cytochrome B5 [Aspergillus nomiae NRRL 13137]
MPSFTLEQVQKHCKPDDVWIVLHNRVYDVTKYLEDHPGGSAILVEVAGTDATEAFEEVGHSDEAREQLEPFYVGDLPTEEQTEPVEIYRPAYEQVSQSAAVNVKKATSWSSIIQTIIKCAMAGLAGKAAITAYHRGITTTEIAYALRSLTKSVSPHQGPGHDGTHFWAGVGIASAVQFSLTLGLGTWISTKLDVQQEFTHYAPRRPAKTARMIKLPRTNLPLKKPSVLDPRKWRSFTLTRKTEVAPHVYRFIFALPNPDDILGLPTGQHIALRATINGQSVSRSYTPVSNNSDVGRIELLIKVYPNGAMTQHLAQMNVGESIEIRGPKGAMQYSRQYAKHIGMIAGGTGITPMYQLIRAICEDDADKTQVSLLYANNTEEDILLRTELDDFATRHPEKFQVQYVLSQPGETWQGYRGFVNGDLIAKHLAPAALENRVLLCGPPPMLAAMKKTLQGMGWTMPGAVSKAGDQVFLF